MRAQPQVPLTAMGNFRSDVRYAMKLGNGFDGTAPMRVPSTAPVYGSRYDFHYYPRDSNHLIRIHVKDRSGSFALVYALASLL